LGLDACSQTSSEKGGKHRQPAPGRREGRQNLPTLERRQNDNDRPFARFLSDANAILEFWAHLPYFKTERRLKTALKNNGDINLCARIKMLKNSVLGLLAPMSC